MRHGKISDGLPHMGGCLIISLLYGLMKLVSFFYFPETLKGWIREEVEYNNV